MTEEEMQNEDAFWRSIEAFKNKKSIRTALSLGPVVILEESEYQDVLRYIETFEENQAACL